MKTKLEYIWLDGHKPEPMLRSKTKVVDGKVKKLSDVELWAFDGSSTEQAEGRFSDCLLKPVKMIPDPDRLNAMLVLCEVFNPDGTPHATNTRAKIKDEKHHWYGFEQEYVLWQNGKPLGFPEVGEPCPQGPYYCGVGAGRVVGRDIVEEHLDLCIEAGLDIAGINAEVLLGQWEFQILGKTALDAGDQLWLARYLLVRTAERYGVEISFLAKPLTEGHWNGSGLHTNFSTKLMREKGGEAVFNRIYETYAKNHTQHMTEYGSGNNLRMSGMYETADIKTFTHGVSDRGAIIRVPVATVLNKHKGYLEDRRPAASADPYRIIAIKVASLNEAKV